MRRFLEEMPKALRRARASSGASLVTVVTLGVGVGACTSVLALLWSTVVLPLPFADAQRLVDVSLAAPGFGLERVDVPDALYWSVRERSRRLGSIALYERTTSELVGRGEPRRVAASRVSSELLDVLGLAPLLGRSFLEEESLSGDAVLVSEPFWRRELGARTTVLGETLLLDGRPRAVVGVAPRALAALFPVEEIFLPLPLDRARTADDDFAYGAVARLAPASNPAQAARELERLLAELPVTHPGDLTPAILASSGLAPRVRELSEAIEGESARLLGLALGAVGIVLLVACADLAHLALMRSGSRRAETRTRVALGASPSDLARLFLAEGALLGLASGALALAVAPLFTRTVLVFAGEALARADEVSVAQGVPSLLGLALALAAGLALGSLPLLELSRRSAPRPASSALVVSQVAASLVLLVGAALMMRSLSVLEEVEPGFEPAAVTAELFLPEHRYSTARDVGAFVERLRETLPADAVGFASRMPLQEPGDEIGIYIEDFPVPEGGLSFVHPVRFVTRGYFEAMGIPIVSGVLDEGLVASAAFADQYWPGADPIGERVSIHEGGEWSRIAAVAGDVRAVGLDRAPPETLYVLVDEREWGLRRVHVVARGARTTAGVLRESVQELDPGLPVGGERSLAMLVARDLSRRRFVLLLVGASALVGLGLGTLGVFGVVGFAASARLREVAIRLALGADRRAIVELFLRRVAKLMALGLGLGLPFAGWASRVLGSWLYGVGALDVTVYAAAVIVLVVAGAAAGFVPAHRAARSDPARLLRRT